MKLRFFLVALLVVVCSGGTVFAAQFLNGQTVYVENPFNDDVYITGGDVNIEQSINGDLVVAAGNVKVYGDVSGDVLALSGDVTINGNVGDDIRIAGANVTINGNVGDDVLTAGGNVNIGKNATIRGDLVTAAASLTLDGTVHGNVKGLVSNVVLRGWIDQSVELTVEGRMTMLAPVHIGGNLKYYSVNRVNIPQGAVVGKVEFNEFQPGQTVKGVLAGYLTKAFLIYQLFSYLGALLVGLVLIWFSGVELKKVTHMIHQKPLNFLGLGFVTFLVGLVSIPLLLITIVGIPLALLFGVLFAAALYVSKIFAALLIGSLFFNVEKIKSSWKMFGVMALGLLIYKLVALIPIVGWIISSVFFLAAFGAFVQYRYKIFENLRTKKVL